jgi:hypothetical protein
VPATILAGGYRALESHNIGSILVMSSSDDAKICHEKTCEIATYVLLMVINKEVMDMANDTVYGFPSRKVDHYIFTHRDTPVYYLAMEY